MVAMRPLLLILAALTLALSASSADARHRHFRFHAWGRAPSIMIAPAPYAGAAILGRTARVYGRERGRGFPPTDWNLQPADPSWHGRRYVSPEGEAWLAFYASPADQEPLAVHLKTVAFVDGEQIHALQGGPDGLIVTGVKGDRMFFRKAQLACRGQQWHHVALEFPAGEQRRYQSLVAEAARALDLADNDGCTAPATSDER